jgi:hypothetical protein
LLVLVLLLGCAADARALMIPETSFEELVARADGIYLGRVLDKRCAWNAERTRIYTHYTVEVEQAYKGFMPGRIELVELGGEVDGLAMEVEGAPSYAAGEQAVIFVHAEGGRLMTLHWFQGKLAVEEEWPGRRKVRMRGSGRRLSLEHFADRVGEVLALREGGRR